MIDNSSNYSAYPEGSACLGLGFRNASHRVNEILMIRHPPNAQLVQLYDDCRLADWDQEGADPITLATLGSAQRLFYALPAHVSLPEFLPEPNGRIAFEWHKGKGNVYAISAGASNQLEFAGLFGPDAEFHGKCSFTDALPDMVLDHLNELSRR